MSAAASLATVAASGAAALASTAAASSSKWGGRPSSPSLALPPAAAAADDQPSFSALPQTNANANANAAVAASPTLLLPPIPVSEDELALRAAREATADLDRLLGRAVAASRALVGRMAGLAADFGALGASLAAFSRWEDERARRGGQYTREGARSLGRATALQTAALGGGRSESLLRLGAARAAAALVALHDQHALVPETAAVLDARERKADDLRVLETEARDRLVQLQRARDAEAAAPYVAAVAAAAANAAAAAEAAAAPGSSPTHPKAAAATREARRVAAAKLAYEAAERQAAALRFEYEEEARRNRAEVGRLSAARSTAQLEALAGLAKSLRELAGAYGELWASIEAQLQQQQQQVE